ncbi:LytR/AlgR family response regulator transcription factor [Spirosoma migulaei]
MESIQLIGHPAPVLISSIVWLEGEANYTRVHYQNGGFSIVTQPLQWFEQHLDFVRIHRSAIINPIYVQEFVQKRGRSGWVRLQDNRVIAVSRNRLEYAASRLFQANTF